MTTRPSFWRQVLAALAHRGPGYDIPTTGERYAQARITYVLAYCDRIEHHLRSKDTVTATEALDVIRCIRGTLNPDGAP
ncbi:hypothetical protein [Streptomyces sp. NBC_00987]|uniref:hypothetical protein n=1 Tax=Streptomyces sp. NBC_00987 TaxID=2903703 RepID=UPI00386B5017|nr:hypothetical protein OG355_41400 [Streptomyces sp. NBC_00987]